MKKKYAQMQQHIVKIIYNDILCVTLTKRNIKRICAELSFVMGNVSWRDANTACRYRSYQAEIIISCNLNEMMIMSAFFYSNTLSWMFIVLLLAQ
jgi:hypothetical protein